MMKIIYTAKGLADAEEYWRGVRKGLAKPEQHDFVADTASIIACHRYNAEKHIEAAAHRMRLVDELVGDYE